MDARMTQVIMTVTLLYILHMRQVRPSIHAFEILNAYLLSDLMQIHYANPKHKACQFYYGSYSFINNTSPSPIVFLHCVPCNRIRLFFLQDLFHDLGYWTNLFQSLWLFLYSHGHGGDEEVGHQSKTENFEPTAATDLALKNTFVKPFRNTYGGPKEFLEMENGHRGLRALNNAIHRGLYKHPILIRRSYEQRIIGLDSIGSSCMFMTMLQVGGVQLIMTSSPVTTG